MSKSGGGAEGSGRGRAGITVARDQDLTTEAFREFLGDTSWLPMAENGWGKWVDRLGWDERFAIEKYATEQYVSINDAARGKSAVTPDVQGTVRGLDKAIASGKTPVDMMLFRGMRWQGLFDRVSSGNLKDGEVMEDKGFVSTTPLRQNAEMYSRDGNAGNRPEVATQGMVLFSIKTPKGTPSAVIGLHHLPISVQLPGEVLLPRGSKFRVEGSNMTTLGFPWGDGKQPLAIVNLTYLGQRGKK